MGIVTIGIDLGQRVDPTAAVVAEPTQRILERGSWRMPKQPGIHTGVDAYWQPDTAQDVFLVRYLERLPLGTSYPAIGERLAEIVTNVSARQPRPQAIYLYADATGSVAGIDLLKEKLRGLPVRLVPVTFTHGDNLTRTANGWSLGKARLVSRLQALLQSDRIKLPRTVEAGALTRELLNYEIRVSQDANDTYGAFKTGTHDDMVTALGLATIEERLRPSQGTFD